MNKVENTIEIDLYSPTSYKVIKAQQGDKNSRIINFEIKDKGLDYIIEKDSVIIHLEGCRGDGSSFIKSDGITVDDNIISVTLDNDILDSHGIVEAKIVMYDTSNAEILSTIPFKIHVQKNPCDKNKVETEKSSVIDSLILEIGKCSKNIESHLADEDAHGYNTKINNEIERATAAESNLDLNKVDKTTVASSSTLGLIKSGTAITVDTDGNVSVNDNSHSHTASNISDLTATASELNVLHGITANTTELNCVDGVTGNIQEQLDCKSPIFSPSFTGTPTATTASTGTNTTQIATTAFVQTAVSNGIAASDAMIIKGTIGTSGTVTSLPTTYKTGWTYRVVTEGTYAGQVCEIGDLIVALIDREDTGNEDSDWCVAQTNINGAITGIKSGDAYIDCSQSGSVVTITHKDVARTNTTSTAAPAFGSTFTAVKSVTSDTKGHVTGVDTETVTFPNTVATTTTAGLESASDKTKLDGIATGAEVNQNAFSNVVVDTTTISADSKTDTLVFISGDNITLTPDATGNKLTISSTNAAYSAGTGITLSGTTFSNSGVRSISTGTTNGTVSVNTNGTVANVSVYGLGTAAYTSSTAYAAASHTHSYLPLSGGTLSGALTVNSTLATTGNISCGGSITSNSSIVSNGTCRPGVDSTSNTTGYKLGNSSYKWMYLYAYSATIQTSDRNAKKDINYEISDKLDQVYDAVNVCTYMMKNGDRTHIGTIAQDWEESLINSGFTLDDYGFICKDHDYEEIQNEETGEYEKVYKYDDNGEPIYVYGLRYEEISMMNMWQTKKLKSRVKELELENQNLKDRIANIEQVLF